MKKFSSCVCSAVFVIFLSIGCSSRNDISVSKTFVLVHGAWQAPYVWQAVKEELERKKQKVIVVELPAHGDDYTLPVNVSMEVYRDKVIDAIKTVKGKVV